MRTRCSSQGPTGDGHPDTAAPTAIAGIATGSSLSDDVVYAVRIGDTLLASAVDDGRGLWWGRGFDRRARPSRFGGLFSGPVGEAVFLGALWRATGDERYRAAALRAAEPTVRSIEEGGGLRDALGLGGVAGFGSLVYGLDLVGASTAEPRVRGASLSAAERLRAKAGETQDLDVYWGMAGSILALLALEGGDSGDPLGAALRLGEAVVERVSAVGSPLIGPGGAVQTTGFAHGSSGIGCALVTLGRRTGVALPVDVGLRLFSADRAAYSAAFGDWLDDPADPDAPPWGAWCRGAAGIALSRLIALRDHGGVGLDDDDVGAISLDLKRALTGTLRVGPSPPHTLCCGSLGRVDVLLLASETLGNPSLAERARGLLRDVRDDAFAHLVEHPGALLGPRGGLWQGAPGLGYMLLRAADPAAFPSILSFAPFPRP